MRFAASFLASSSCSASWPARQRKSGVEWREKGEKSSDSYRRMAVPVVGRGIVLPAGFLIAPLLAVGRIRPLGGGEPLRLTRGDDDAYEEDAAAAAAGIGVQSMASSAAGLNPALFFGLANSTCETCAAKRRAQSDSFDELSAGLRFTTMAVLPSPDRQGCKK